jgi:hypothetical protein
MHPSFGLLAILTDSVTNVLTKVESAFAYLGLVVGTAPFTELLETALRCP